MNKEELKKIADEVNEKTKILKELEINKKAYEILTNNDFISSIEQNMLELAKIGRYTAIIDTDTFLDNHNYNDISALILALSKLGYNAGISSIVGQNDNNTYFVTVYWK
jgi:hypothetical protein